MKTATITYHPDGRLSAGRGKKHFVTSFVRLFRCAGCVQEGRPGELGFRYEGGAVVVFCYDCGHEIEEVVHVAELARHNNPWRLVGRVEDAGLLRPRTEEGDWL